LFLFAFVIVSSHASENVRFEPLVIQEQGSFAVGGTVVATPGTFDPNHPGVRFPKDEEYLKLKILALLEPRHTNDERNSVMSPYPLFMVSFSLSTNLLSSALNL
jgi:hypothetical protein